MRELNEAWDELLVYLYERLFLIIERSIFSRPLRDRQWRWMALLITQASHSEAWGSKEPCHVRAEPSLITYLAFLGESVSV